jgi:hypothetical protein
MIELRDDVADSFLIFFKIFSFSSRPMTIFLRTNNIIPF